MRLALVGLGRRLALAVLVMQGWLALVVQLVRLRLVRLWLVRIAFLALAGLEVLVLRWLAVLRRSRT